FKNRNFGCREGLGCRLYRRLTRSNRRGLSWSHLLRHRLRSARLRSGDAAAPGGQVGKLQRQQERGAENDGREKPKAVKHGLFCLSPQRTFFFSASRSWLAARAAVAASRGEAGRLATRGPVAESGAGRDTGADAGARSLLLSRSAILRPASTITESSSESVFACRMLSASSLPDCSLARFSPSIAITASWVAAPRSPISSRIPSCPARMARSFRSIIAQ